MPSSKPNRFRKKCFIVCGLVILYLVIGFGKFFIANCFGNKDGDISSPLLLTGFGILFTLCFAGILIVLFWDKTISRISLERRKVYACIGGIVFAVFVLSSNMAWLNPRPDFSKKKGNFLKLNHNIPFMWQYNFDSHPEFYSAAFFPSYFKANPTRINRPVYPMIVHLSGKLSAYISRPFLILTPQACAVIGFIFLKLAIYLIGGILLFELIQKYVGKEAALYSIPLLFFHKISIWYVSEYHTIELQFISPIIVLYLFSRLSASYSVKKNILFSLIVGMLMLAKQNYAVYLAVLGFALLHKRFRETCISFCSHLAPLLGWLVFLKLYGLKYYNHEVEVYGQGVWLYREFIHLPIVEMIKAIFQSFREYLIAIIQYYFIWAFLGVFGLGVWIALNKGKIKNELVLMFLCVAANWFQVFAARRYEDYMVSDCALFFYALSGYFLVSYVKKKWLIYVILLLWLFFNLLQIIHLPWIHPYNQ